MANGYRTHGTDHDRRDMADAPAGMTQALDDIPQLTEGLFHAVNTPGQFTQLISAVVPMPDAVFDSAARPPVNRCVETV